MYTSGYMYSILRVMIDDWYTRGPTELVQHSSLQEEPRRSRGPTIVFLLVKFGYIACLSQWRGLRGLLLAQLKTTCPSRRLGEEEWGVSTLWVYFKGTQDWDFFWLRFWNLYYFFVSYVKILRFYRKKFLIGPLLGEVRFFRAVLGLRTLKKILS
jgi:hypothetical protein